MKNRLVAALSLILLSALFVSSRLAADLKQAPPQALAQVGPTIKKLTSNLQSKTGSEIVTARYGKRRWDYNFEENTITEIKE